MMVHPMVRRRLLPDLETISVMFIRQTVDLRQHVIGGLKMTLGNVIAFLDVDDLWSANKLQLQLAQFANDTALEIVMVHQLSRYLTGVEKGKLNVGQTLDSKMFITSFGAAIFRKSVFDKVGLLSESLHYFEDLDWFMRARELGVSTVVLDDVTLIYRRHKHNMTNKLEPATGYRNMLKVFKMSLDRRRQQNEGLFT